MTRRDVPTRRTATALGAAAILSWSCYGVLLASNSVTPPLYALAIVFSCATLALLGLRLVRGEGLSGLAAIPAPTLALGMLGLLGSNGLYIAALALGGEPVAINIASLSWPVWMVAIIVASGQARCTLLDAAAMLVGMAGVAVLVGRDGLAGVSWPVLVAAAGALCWAVYSALRNTVPAGPPDAMTGFVAASAVVCWGLALAIETPATTPAEVLRLAIVGVIPVGLANLAWDHGVRHGDTVLLAGLSFIEPILSTFWIALFLSRPVGATEIVAIALVLCAVALSFAGERRRRLGRR